MGHTTKQRRSLADWEDKPEAPHMPLGEDFEPRTPVPPFLADSASSALHAVKLPSACEMASWWLANAHLIQQIIDELHPVHGCELPSAVRPIPDAATFTTTVINFPARRVAAAPPPAIQIAAAKHSSDGFGLWLATNAKPQSAELVSLTCRGKGKPPREVMEFDRLYESLKPQATAEAVAA